jgi:tetratricopeptide (TPR) repeat protein
MLIVRRPEKSAAPVSPAEVLLSLHAVTVARGQDEKAKEILDSALEAAVQEPAALARLRERLEATGDLATLAHVLEKRAATLGDAALEAATLRELAEVQARLGKQDVALGTLIKAIRLAPADAALHARTREVARETEGGLERYLGTLEAFVERRRRREDVGVVARLLLWAGRIFEEDRADPAGALAYYQRAADVNEVAAEALALAARAARSGDPSVRRGILDKLGRLARQAPTATEKADLLFRLAEAELEDPATRDAGLGTLSAALDEKADIERALAIVGRAAIRDEELPRILPLYERTARERGDERLLLDCLLRRARGAHPRPEFLREGYDLAVALADDAAAEQLLDVLAQLGRSLPGAEAEATWAGLERARRRRGRGDLSGAYASLMEVLELGETAPVMAALRDLVRPLLDAAETRGEQAALGAQILETLRARQPDDSALVKDLLDLYERIPDRLGYERLMREMLERAVTATERNPLRLRLAAFIARSEPEDPVVLDLLQDVLLEEPAHGEAAALLAEAFERRGDHDRLHALLFQQLGEAEGHDDKGKVVALVKRLLPSLRDERPDEAVALLQRGLTAEPGEPDLVRALVMLIPGADAARVETIDHILDAQPETAKILPWRQAAYEKAELWDAVARLHETQAQRETDLGRMAARLRAAAEVYRTKLYDADTAAELLRRARAVRPGDGELALDLVGCLVELGRANDALTQAQLALRQLNAQTRVEVKLALMRAVADLFAEQGQSVEAISLYQDILAIAPPELQGEVEEILVRLKGEAAPPDAPEDTNPGDAIPVDEILAEITNEIP